MIRPAVAAALSAFLLAGCSDGGAPGPAAQEQQPQPDVRRDVTFEGSGFLPAELCTPVSCVVNGGNGIVWVANVSAPESIVAWDVTVRWHDGPGALPDPLDVRIELRCRGEEAPCAQEVLDEASGQLPLTLSGTAETPPGTTLTLWADHVDPPPTGYPGWVDTQGTVTAVGPA